MRPLQTILALGAAIICSGGMARPPVNPDRPNGQKQITLMQTLEEWKYPDSILHGGASMSDGGNRMLQSIKCRAILTTPDPIEKVVNFYSKRLIAPPDVILPNTKADELVADGKSVSIQDDSQGRPLALKVIVVHKDDTSTTLVISRANDEKETHIAWSHYIRLGDKK
jgi:hypothetical protein